MSNVAAAFVKAKRQFGPALKCKTNPAFKSKYADLAACLEAVDEALLANGISLIQETFDDMTGVTVETVFLHESGETIRCGKLHVPASKQDPQGYGSALSYARRYSLMAACGIAAEDDDGQAACQPMRQQPKPLTDSAVSDFITMINDCTTMDALKKAFEAAYRAAHHIGDIKHQESFEKAKDARKVIIQSLNKEAA